MKYLIKSILIFSLTVIVFLPIFVNAQTKIIPDCGTNQECGFAALLELVNNIIKWVILISVPVAAGVFAWAGIQYMTTGVADKKKAATEMLQKVFIGFVVILAAWIIVTTITNTLLSDSNGFKGAVPVEGVK